MSKKIISVVLVIVTVLSTLTVTASAASYSTGNYTVAASNGSNIRTGAGTGYSRVGAASKGVTFYVSKVSGNWGYTASIKSTTGVKKGWVCLDYCTYKGSSGNSSRATYNDVFASVNGSGKSLSQARNTEATTFTKGTFVYVWGFLHDANNNLYKSYGSGKCNMTLSIYRPDGSCAYSYTYKNCDNNWIGQRLDQAGTWKIQSKITGSLSGTNTRTITVKENTSATYTLSYNANGGSNAPSAQKVKANTAFYLRNTKPTRSGYTFLGWSTNKSASSASYAPGAYVRINSNITLYAVWKKNPASNNLSSRCNIQNTYYIGKTKYYQAVLKSTYKGVSSGTVVYLNSNYTPVTNKDILKKLMFTHSVNMTRNSLMSLADCYYSVSNLNDVCQDILSVQSKQKILGSVSGSFASIMISKNPKSLISSCTYLTEEGYIDLLTAVLLEEVSALAISSANSVKKYCSDGISSYEEAIKVKSSLVNGRTAFLFAGTDCMLGLVDDYTTIKGATKKSLKTHFSAMFNTLVGTYGKALGDVVDICSNGATALDQLKNIYGYSKCSSKAKSTFDNLFDSKVNSSINTVASTQAKLNK